MTKVTIIGATGSLGTVATETLLAETDAQLRLFSRSADKLETSERVEIIAGSIYQREKLNQAITQADVIFAALSGDLPSMAEALIKAMKDQGSRRLVFISSYGIYGEIAGNPRISPVLAPYRQAADLIEQSGLDYTILRPAWFDNSPDLSYQAIPKGQVVHGHAISRKAIAQVLKKIVEDSNVYKNENLALVR